MSAIGVTIQLDVPRRLRFDGEALLRLEEITGQTVLQICKVFSPDKDSEQSKQEEAEEKVTNFSFTLIAQIAQAGLTEDLPRATTKDIIKLMDEYGKGEGSVQRIFSYTIKVFSALSEAVGVDPKNVQADLEKMEKAAEAKPSPDRKKSKSGGVGKPTNV